MRIRTRDSRTSAPLIFVTHDYRGTTATGPFGSRSVLPRVLNGTPGISNPAPFISGTLEQIEDEIPDRKFIGNVRHTKRFVQEPLLTRRVNTSAGYLQLRASYSSELKLILTNDYREDTANLASARSFFKSQKAFEPFSANVTALAAGGRSDDRLHELVPKIMDRLDNLHLANTLYEARELPTLWKMFRRREALARLLSRFKAYGDANHLRNLRGVGGNSGHEGHLLKDMSRSFREGQLNWSFGLMPTIGDMKAINNELRGRRPRKDRFTVRVSDHHDVPFNSTRTYSSSLGTQSCSHLESRMRIFGCRVEVTRPESMYYSDFFKKWQAAEDKYIGYNPAGIIWEAVPFSFAIDWLLSLDNVLDALFLMNSDRVSTQYWSSNKISAKRTIMYQYLSDVRSSGLVPLNVTVPDVYEWADQVHVESVSDYKRDRREPPSPLSQVRVRGGTKQVYLLALIALGLRGGSLNKAIATL